MPAAAPDWPEPSEPLAELVGRLAEADGPADEGGVWSEALWQTLVRADAHRWALPGEFGGLGLGRSELLRRYARVAEGSLTAAFVLTQHDAAVRRLVPAAGRGRVGGWLGAIGRGEAFTTVGISQLTTSRRHGASALRAAERPGGGLRLDGVMPWVTAAERAEVLVTGAALDDGRQALVALPAERPGVAVQPPFPLAALQASCTAEVRLEGVEVGPEDVIAGPVADVMAQPGAAGTGGLETSALALGQARAALVALAGQAEGRDDLAEPFETLAAAWSALAAGLLDASDGRPDAPAAGEVRRRANALVLRCTQAYLTARKGTGFLRAEPAQRWARQALFFLVWSCPSPVAQASIRDLAGLCSA
jgi:alkylation response protein AidB-like acyl-CoA dehydrogenase